MMTPALQNFLDQTGKMVHYLNTIAVGLSAVEAGVAKKPVGLDISWSPHNVVASARQARAYALRATIVTVAEEIGSFISDLAKYPGVMLDLSTKKERWEKFAAVKDHFSLAEDHRYIGPLLVIHWRNRIIHRNSNAGLTKAQRDAFIEETRVVKDNYKNLDPSLVLEHFERNTPTLKDVSSLIAMSINFAKSVSGLIQGPTSAEEVTKWIECLSLTGDLDRVRRVGASKGKEHQSVTAFLTTHCPSLLAPYFFYIGDNG
ncbi:MAG: hypothetical protein JSR66_01515 [Proteobacteria bacterium]|nr:hypothetical protein [Pseudomonadota bacterium]